MSYRDEFRNHTQYMIRNITDLLKSHEALLEALKLEQASHRKIIKECKKNIRKLGSLKK